MSRRTMGPLLIASALAPMMRLCDGFDLGPSESNFRAEPIPDPKPGEPGSNPEKAARKKAMKARRRRIQR